MCPKQTHIIELSDTMRLVTLIILKGVVRSIRPNDTISTKHNHKINMIMVQNNALSSIMDPKVHFARFMVQEDCLFSCPSCNKFQMATICLA